MQEDGYWRFYYNDGSGIYVRDDWYCDNGTWYWFDGAGHMVTDTWYRYKDHWYYLGEEGAMRTGQVTVDGKWYCIDSAGRMITEPITLIPDQDGALQMPGLIK